MNETYLQPTVQVQNLAMVDRKQLVAFLKDLRRWVKEKHTSTKNSALETKSTTPGDVIEFRWNAPGDPEALPETGPLPRDTSLKSLGFGVRAIARLNQKNIATLQDFGQYTTEQLGDMFVLQGARLKMVILQLSRCGLSVKHSECINRFALDLCAQIRSKEASREHLHDASPIYELGLTSQQMSACVKRNLMTIGELRAQSLLMFGRIFGARDSARDVIQQLQDSKLPILCPITQIGLWNADLLSAKELVYPPDDAPLSEARPWFDSYTYQRLQKIGVTQVGQVRELVGLYPLVRLDLGSTAYMDLFKHFNIKVCRTWPEVFDAKARFLITLQKRQKVTPSLLDRVVHLPSLNAPPPMTDHKAFCAANGISEVKPTKKPFRDEWVSYYRY